MRLQNRRALGSVLLATGAVVALAGCGAGQLTQTDSQLPAVNGAFSQAQTVVIRDAALVNPGVQPQAYTAGSTAPLTLSVVNLGVRDDQLVAVSSPLAASADYQGSQNVVAGSSLIISPADQGTAGTDSTGDSGQVSASPAAPVSPSVAGQPNAKPVGKASVSLQGLKSVVWAGQTVPVTFTFAQAGPVTVQLPMAAPTQSLPGYPRAEGPGTEK